ncbi:MAG: YbaB/EbfC family nucleoid-associated protein [Micromonosporaceae bacterium]|nr:YbaB/EbfC family nucleoid-associated protein [Micromonosporaceae bacterium]
MARQHHALSDMQRRMAETGAVATSKNRAISVRLDGQGNVIEVKFLTGGYRSMAPAELGALLVDTIAEARAELTGQIADILGQVMPGSAVLDALNGNFDMDSMMDEVIAEAVDTQTFFDPGAVPDGPGASRQGATR